MKRHIATREDIQKLHDHRKKHGWPKTFDGDRSARKDGLTIEQVAESIKGLNTQTNSNQNLLSEGYSPHKPHVRVGF